MRHVRLCFACLLACSLLAVPSAAGAASPSQRMAQKINHARAQHGLGPVRLSRALTRSSFRYSRRVMSRDHFAHGLQARPSGYNVFGEVLALHPGRHVRVGFTVRAWLRSPGHRAVLLSPAFRVMGAGYSRGRIGGRRRTSWTAQFGRR